MKLNLLLIVGLAVGNSLNAMERDDRKSSPVALTTIQTIPTGALGIDRKERAEASTITSLEAQIEAKKSSVLKHELDRIAALAKIKNENDKIELAKANILQPGSRDTVFAATSAISNLEKQAEEANRNWLNNLGELEILEGEKKSLEYNHSLSNLGPIERWCKTRPCPGRSGTGRTRFEWIEQTCAALVVSAGVITLLMIPVMVYK